MNRSIVFDMDGVIFDTENLIMKTWIEIAGRKGIENIEDTLHACLGVNVLETKAIFLKNYGKDFDFDTFRKEADTIFFKTVKEEGMPVKLGAPALLHYLKERDYQIALASSTRVEVVKDELKQAGLLEYFSSVIGGDMVRHSKPHPEIYQTACRCLQAVPGETMAVEDSFNGVRSAYAAGLKVIMVPDILQPTEEIEKMLFLKSDSLLAVRDFLQGQEIK